MGDSHHTWRKSTTTESCQRWWCILGDFGLLIVLSLILWQCTENYITMEGRERTRPEKDYCSSFRFFVSVYFVIMLYVDSLPVTTSFFPELELCDIGAETWEEHTVRSPQENSSDKEVRQHGGLVTDNICSKHWCWSNGSGGGEACCHP